MTFTPYTVILVTGASGGIGRAICSAASSSGARVAVHYNGDRAGAKTTLESLAGGGHALFQADLRDPEQAGALIAGIAETMGGLNVLVNNAGLYRTRSLWNHDFASWQRDWEDLTAINLTAPAMLMFLAARVMKSGGGGRIVNIASRGAFRGEPEAVAYGAAKAGLVGLTQSMAVALAPDRIGVTAVAPGFVNTEMARPYLESENGETIRNQSPLGRVAEPDEVARTVLFLASPDSLYLTGTVVDINGASFLRM